MIAGKIGAGLAAVALAGFANAASTPVSRDLPFPEHDFSYAAAASQNVYCGWHLNQPGQMFEDSTVLTSYGDQDYVQRVSITHSPSQGVYIAVAGTNISAWRSNIRDWEDALIPGAPALGLPHDALVFAGWQMGFNEIWEYVKSGIHEVQEKYPGAPVTVTGHSQGSGIANLLALAIENMYPNLIKNVITFGNVRAGNAAFTRVYDSKLRGRSVGVANGKDWVADVPSYTIGYKHTAGQVWITPANSTEYYYYADGDDPAWIAKWEPQLEWFVPGSFPPKRFWGDHQGHYMHVFLSADFALRGVGPCPAKIDN